MTTIFDVPGTNPPSPFSPLVQRAFQSCPHESAKLSELTTKIVEQVTSSPDPATAFWSLWDAFFIKIAASPSLSTPGSDPFAAQLALLDALRAHPPTAPTNIPTGSDAELRLRTTYLSKTDHKIHWSQLPGFDAQWRDVHDILEARRDWDGARAQTQKQNTSDTPAPTGEGESESDIKRHDPARYFLRFIDFSVALLRLRQQQQRQQQRQHSVNVDCGGGGGGGVDGGSGGGGGDAPLPLSLAMWVFFNCKKVLEREGGPERPAQCKGHGLSPAQVWALDVRVTAAWVRGGAGVLWEADWDGLRKDYAAALDQKTELWPGGEGMTRGRWVLWGRRLRELLGGEEGDGVLDEETRDVVKEAVEVIEGLLQGE